MREPTTVPSAPAAAWERLEAALTGTLLLPGSAAYESARHPARLQPVDQRPVGIVRAADGADVAAAIAFGREHGVATVPRSGGHCYAGRSSTSGLLVDVTPMDRIEVADGRVTVGAGVRLGPLYDTLEPHGRTVPMGTCPTVGVAGHVLGGGLGFLGRAHGLASDRLVAAEVVLADGRLVWCDEAHDADLLWALRGSGGGQFGVVTSLVLETVPTPATTSAFHLTWPYEHAAAVIGAWQAWAPQAPDEVVPELRLVVPGDRRTAPEVSLFGMVLDADAQATTGLLANILDAVEAEPTWVFHEQGPYLPAVRRLNLLGSDLPPGAVPTDLKAGRSEFFRQALPSPAVSALVERLLTDRMPGYARECTFFAWGGAYDRVPVDATAFAHREESFLLDVTTVADDPTPQVRSAAQTWLAGTWDVLHPWGAGGAYTNFPAPGLEDWAAAYHGTNLARLRAVKRRYDPGDWFRFPQSVAPAEA
ncbi:FAD-binding oxidoreductase [Jiangella ureilytica]|uniref:FAD-binding oxidoreductase n=1 Tax=Jiangella ureilytica TaxID=2530374 RepID=A0A4R4RK29_9ACTN|nr:FAD-binding oxidoreductase [Jiangella ureilytica]TDC49339.1 FAD-binding oxidoreductase [Jiangella ureilytica]